MRLTQARRLVTSSIHHHSHHRTGSGISQSLCRGVHTFLSESHLIPGREEQINRLKSTPEFDILVIGGGSTGAGAALDAATRGLNVACVEQEDFGSGTSSRSTKLIWGGSRYLVEAFVALFNFDLRLLHSPKKTITKFKQDFKMVMNCHRERKFMLLSQPHLVKWIPIAVPLTKWLLWPPPFKYPLAAIGPLGLFPVFFKFYDALSGFTCPPAHIMTPSRTKRKFPQMVMDELKYCSVFYEGQFDDARTNLAVAQTAAREGATMGNYCRVVSLTHDSNGKVNGAIVKDEISGETFPIKAKGVLLCGGPFTDSVRKMEDKDGAPAVTGARGIHIVLPGYFAPPDFGLVDMNTSDGRFMFYLPWEGHVIIGTTDHRTEPTMRPVPPETEILWILNEAKKYLNPELKLRRKDVLSSWSGIRPLAVDPNADPSRTASVSRDHVVSHNPKTDMVFVSGGKWTTFREMAEDAVNKIVEVAKLKPKSGSKTLKTGLVGREGYTQNLPARLVQEYDIPYSVATHLTRAYGGRAFEVCDIVREEEAAALQRNHDLGNDNPEESGGITRIVEGYPYITAEVKYAVRKDWARRVDDILARRTRLLFLNKDAAIRAVPHVLDIMANELNWSAEKKQEEALIAYEYIHHFGGPIPATNQGELARLATTADIEHHFEKIDSDHDDRIDYDEIVKVGISLGRHLSEEEVSSCISICDEKKRFVIEKKDFVAWWNSEHANPLLAKMKSHMAGPHAPEGSGTMFG